MNAQTKVKVDPLALLREPFPEHHISKLPKETKAQIDARKADKRLMVFNCKVCGGHHHKDAVHLDYVGHAALTDRLLDCDPAWYWEPCTLPGLPNPGNGMWITLHVAGVSRIGYGSADGKTGGDAIKEIIGDALRNAAMRFGAALDLWHKGDLHLDAEEVGQGHSEERAVSPAPQPEYPFPDGPATGITQLKSMVRPLWRDIAGCSDLGEYLGLIEAPENKAIIDQCSRLQGPHRRELWEGDGKDNPGLSGHMAKRHAELEKLNDMNALTGGQFGKVA